MNLPYQSKYSKAILILLLPIFLQACSTTYSYSKPGITQTGFNKDKYECKRENTYVTSNNYQRIYVYRGTAYSSSYNYPSSDLDKDGYHLCMEARGYKVETLKEYCSRKPYDPDCS
jgi:hypothetical protein